MFLGLAYLQRWEIMATPQILVTNDDGWDAPGLAALRRIAATIGDVFVVAPRDPHSYAGHRVTTDTPLALQQTAPGEFHLSGTPADCVRVALTTLFPHIDLVLSGINRGGNLGVDIYSSGTVAAAREAAVLGRPAIAISQYIRRGLALDWDRSANLAAPVIARLLAAPAAEREYWNVNLPHLDADAAPAVTECQPDTQPLDVRYERDGPLFRFTGTYAGRPRTAGLDIERCFGGSVTVSRLRL
jgi:5'-nucleotidase